MFTVLDIINEHGSARIGRGDFDLAMQRRGASGDNIKSAIAMMERRRWVHVIGFNLIFTEKCLEAARAPEALIVEPKAKTRGNKRMPRGLF